MMTQGQFSSHWRSPWMPRSQLSRHWSSPWKGAFSRERPYSKRPYFTNAPLLGRPTQHHPNALLHTRVLMTSQVYRLTVHTYMQLQDTQSNLRG